MIYLLQPSMPVTSWRTLWPGEELRRRGHDVQIDSMDAGYGPEDPPIGALTVIHLTPSLFALDAWWARVQQAAAAAGRLMVQLDDDWTRLPEVQQGIWDR